MFRFIMNNLFRKAIDTSVNGVSVNNAASRFKTVMIKWFSFGAGFAVMCALIIAAVSWYSNRPKPWNPSAITAVFDSFDIDSENYNLILYYILENKTSADYELQSTSKTRLMQKLKRQDSLIDGEGVLYDTAVFIPAKNKVQFALKLNASFKKYFPANMSALAREERSKKIASFANGEMTNMNGFVLFDETNHYEILFPKSW